MAADGSAHPGAEAADEPQFTITSLPITARDPMRA